MSGELEDVRGKNTGPGTPPQPSAAHQHPEELSLSTVTIIEGKKINLWGGNSMALVASLSSFAVALVVALPLLGCWWQH